jgi:hypothetical protein
MEMLFEIFIALYYQIIVTKGNKKEALASKQSYLFQKIITIEAPSPLFRNARAADLPQ